MNKLSFTWSCEWQLSFIAVQLICVDDWFCKVCFLEDMSSCNSCVPYEIIFEATVARHIKYPDSISIIHNFGNIFNALPVIQAYILSCLPTDYHRNTSSSFTCTTIMNHNPNSIKQIIITFTSDNKNSNKSLSVCYEI